MLSEQEYEELLNIKTRGKQDLEETSLHYNRYEPTDYSAIKRLFDVYKLTEDDVIIDYGSGKGRLNFYINYFFNSKVIGIEMNPFFYKESLKNKEDYLKAHKNKKASKIEFVKSIAEDAKIDINANKFYFFNPFSVLIFMKVLEKILDSLSENKREIDLVLYYPSDDYIYFLNNATMFELVHDVKLPIAAEDPRERFLVYRLSKEYI